MRAFLKTIIYIPLYNALVALIVLMPGHSAGLAVILLTLLIRIILFPLSRKAIKTQIEMRRIEPEVKRIRETVKDRQEQAQALMQLYKDRDINPFASLVLIIIQLPILIGLYSVFRSGLPMIKPELLYSFIHVPEFVSMIFVGIDLAGKSLVLALAAVITQFIQINLALPKSVKKEKGTFQEDLAHNLNMQMRYIMPLVLFPIAYFSAVIALYFTTSNILMTLQEIFIKRRLERKLEPKV
ncbi:YidC/Oxa1 family membrane protein insertase [Candidatus Parcubacteria bacterium]|nr:YidC/Oxa1 family membrane protein insertase [Candidatus Parcubacteria bacterium]